jgi:peptidoglycan/LPS O-acetylase OafA/YrhL
VSSTPIIDDHPQPSTPVRRFLARFSRVTTSGGFISEIDGLRFIAIATVVLFHLMVNAAIKSPGAYTPPATGNLLAKAVLQGYHGVELFFIISGFILALPFAAHHLKGQRPVALGPYFVRRVTRLEPPYIVAMVLIYVALVLVKGRSAQALLPHLGASLVYGHNLVFGQESLINNVAWSLEVEIQFYLLVPLLAQVFAVKNHRLRRGIIVGVASASVLLGWWFIQPESRAYLSILRFLHFFLLGFLLADVFLVNWDGKPGKSRGWDLVSLVGWPALFAVWSQFDPTNMTPGEAAGRGSLVSALFFPPAAFVLYLAAFRGRLTNVAITNPWITTIGGMCYSIYLLHNPLLGAMLSVTRGLVPTGSYTLNLTFQALLAIPVILIPSGLFFLLVEKPCMRKDWPQRFAERVRQSLPFGRPA